ncbi:MAG: aspartate dehydrogenase [Eubacteriales bacterium]|nr:aspartate dehydrogenase [Eubacteriales bacterium]
MFWKKKEAAVQTFDREKEIPVIRSSICTGEQVAGFKDKNSGHFREIMCIRSQADRDRFLSDYGIGEAEIRKEW